MLRKLGFTLVELLVVMAIISILAAIAVPNIMNYISRARATRALSEISGIETSLIKMLSDSGRNSLNQLFNAQAVADILGMSPDPMFEAQQIYTNTLYALLREGRIALSDVDPNVVLSDGSSLAYGRVLDVSAVSKLGTSYMDVTLDPWKRMYQIFPGPWNQNNGPVIFRTYLREESESNLPGQKKHGNDGYQVDIIDVETEEPLTVGFPAARDQVAFIYSTGENMVAGQMIYIPFWWGVPNPNVKALYDANQGEQYFGGGDDVNNWDKGASWERFY